MEPMGNKNDLNGTLFSIQGLHYERQSGSSDNRGRCWLTCFGSMQIMGLQPHAMHQCVNAARGGDVCNGHVGCMVRADVHCNGHVE